MKVLIISTNRENLPDPVAPLGAAYVATAVREAGHEVRLLDLQFAVDVPVAIKDTVRAFKPHVIGLSIRNIDNVAFPHSQSYLPDILQVVKTLKSIGAKLVVAGGSAFTLMPREILDALGLNLGLIGEGEVAFPELLRRIGEGLPINDLPGLVYRYNGEIRINAPRMISNLNASPEPDRLLIDNVQYMEEGGSGNLQTKRGCAFGCAYCTYPIVEGRKVRLRSPSLSADEFERAFKIYGLKHIFIVDNVFNFPIDHAKEFCRELISRDINPAWSCYLNPAHMDEELVELMLKAGCRGVEFGTDSGVNEILANLGKGFRVGDIVKASKLCADAGLSFCHSLLLGAPGETARTVEESLSLMEVLRPNAVIAMLGIRVFPGTGLERRAKEEGVIKEGGPGLKPLFYFSPTLDMDAVSQSLAKFGREHTNFIMPGIHLRMTDKIRTRLRSYGFTGPLWEYLRA